MPKPKSDRGAPAVAARLEQHEADAEAEVNRIKGQLAALRELVQPNGEKETQAALGDQIAKLQRDLEGAYDLWFKLSKQVREYDKAVSEQRRDGEKLPRVDVEEWFRQLLLCVDLGLESYIISLSQDACRAESPEQFYTIHAENLRSTKASALESAVRDGKLPEWVV